QIMDANDGNKALPRADNKKNSAAQTNNFFLPKRSPKLPDAATPAMHPTNADDTSHPSWAGVKLKFSCMSGKTPEITAISNPKEKPPIAAIKQIRAMKKFDFFMMARFGVVVVRISQMP